MRIAPFFLVATLASSTGACGGKQPDPTPTAKPPETAAPPAAQDAAVAPELAAAVETSLPAADVALAAEASTPSNPAIAELAPLWDEIDKCEDTSDRYSAEQCPACYKLLEAVNLAYSERDKRPDRFAQIHEALIDQLIHGKNPKSRSCAAYADWAKCDTGGRKYDDDVAQAIALLDALKALDAEDEGVGEGIANILRRWWKKGGEPRKAMFAVIADENVKSLRGRRQLIRHAGWAAQDVPELVDALIAWTKDARVPIQTVAIEVLGDLTPGAEVANKAQGRLLELLGAESYAVASAAAQALARVTDRDGLDAALAWYKANAAAAKVTETMAFFLSYVAVGKRFEDDAAGDAAIRKAIDALLEDKGLTADDKGYIMFVLGLMGGPRSAATCVRFAKDKDTRVAAKAKACVDKAKATK